MFYPFYVQVSKIMALIILTFSLLIPFTPANQEIAEIRAGGIVLPEGFTVTAHAGAMYTPDNTIFSLKQIVATDADIVEFDLHFRADGTAVLSHDAPAENGGVLLADALEVIAGNPVIRMNIDAKSARNLPVVQELLIEYGLLDRAFFTGIERGRVAAVKRDCPEVPFYLNCSIAPGADLQALADEVKGLGALGVNINYNDASRELCEVMHANGLLVSVWTVNDILSMYKMLSFGVDNITTRNPILLREIINNRL